MSPRIAILCIVFLGACGGSDHAIDASHYDHRCSTSADCVAVYQGDLTCCGGGCPNTAIARASYDDYASTVTSRIPMCSPALPCADIACANQAALCADGLCTFATSTASADASF